MKLAVLDRELAKLPVEAFHTAQTILGIWLDGAAPNTREARERDLRAFGAWAWQLESEVQIIAQLFALGPHRGRAHAQAFDDHNMKRGLAATTRSRMLSSLRGVIRIGNEHGLPWTLTVRAPKYSPYGRAKGTPIETVLDVIKHLKRFEKWSELALVLLMYESGLRVSEAASLKIENIDYVDAAVLVKRKNMGEVWVPISRRCADCLYQYINFRAKGWVFHSPRTATHITRITIFLLIRRLGLNHPHALRHAGAKQIDAKTKDVRLAQSWLSHKNLSTTQVYLGELSETAREGVEILSDEIGMDDD